MALDNHELLLIVDGKKFGGWLDVRVSRGIERAAADFEIKASQRWPGLDGRFAIAEGATCEIWIGQTASAGTPVGDKVLTGYVDLVDIERDANNAHLTIAGRSKTADLVDCSPDFETTELAGLDLAAVARKVAQPFGIQVDARDTGPAFQVAAAHKGETAWKLIERLARQRQLLVMDDPEGRLVLTRLAAERADDELVHPADGLRRIGTKRDASKRFSIYKVKAQAGGTTRWAGIGSVDGAAGGDIASAVAHVEGGALDTGVKRYRPKTVLSEGAAKKEGALARAQWEARRNMGRALTVRATRVGWRQKSGKLWTPNTLVRVKVPNANLEAELALSEVTYRKGADGTLVELELASPEAFTPEPPESPAAGGEGGNRWAGMGNAIGEG
jgi:prophage tail gpP-like protein